MGRRRTTEPPEESPAICRQFEWVLSHLFGGSITHMAAALDVSHPALSRVINKGQMPSGQMLAGLARLRLVNLHWVLAGGDEKSARPAEPATEFVPVAEQLLPGSPSNFPEKLGPLGLPTSSPFLLEAAYWFRVRRDNFVVGRTNAPAAVDDYLLVETGPAWTTRTEAHEERLLVLRHPDRQEGLLAQFVEDYSVDEERELDTFGLLATASILTSTNRSDAKKQRGPVGQTFYRDDVVGVVLEKRTLYGRARR
jgi:hypothetical protein